MFLVVGLVTVAMGITVVFLLPDNPMSSRLTPTQKYHAIERLRENQTGIENKHFKPHQFVECLRDPQTWLLALICCSSNVPNGAVSSFQATIIKNFGYTSKESALLSIPSGAVSIVSNYLTNCIGASLPLLYSWVSANYAGHTKKVTMNAILLMSFCLGNILGPLTFRKSDAPDYTPAKIAIIVTCAFAAFVAVMLRFYYMWENKRRDGLVSRGEVRHLKDGEFADRTDRENLEFRYRL